MRLRRCGVSVVVIKRKADIQAFLDAFPRLADWGGGKHYICLVDAETGGTITLMRSSDGVYTFHRKNDRFWDVRELPLTDDVIWKNRKVINRLLRERAE